MIRTEPFNVNGRAFIRTWSDAGRYVVRDGEEYTEACDPAELGRTYEEGGYITDAEGPEEVTPEEAFSIIFGGEAE